MKQMITIVSAKGNRMQKMAEVSTDGKSASIERKAGINHMYGNGCNCTFYYSNGDGTFRRVNF